MAGRKKPKAAAVEELGRFELLEKKDAYMWVSVNRRLVVIDFSGDRENSQEDLKAVYDKGKQYRAFIKPPEKYIAPWQNPL